MLERIPLAYYVLSGLLNFTTSFILAIFVFSRNPKSSVNRIFSIFALGASCWGLFHFLWLSTVDKSSLAEFYLRTVMLFVIFVPATFTHFILAFLKIDNSKKINVGNYLISFVIGSTAYTHLFAKDMGAFLVFPYWLKPGPVFHFHLIHFLGNIIYSHILMLGALKRHLGIFRNQILYVFIGTAIGYTAGVFNYFPWYRIPIPPFLNPLVSIYVAFISYAIFKYRLMDINLVFRSWLIFLPYAVISIAAFVIINVLFHNLFWINTGSIILLILGTPFIYQYLQRHSRAVIDSTIYKDKFTYVERMEKFIDRMPLIPREKDLFRNTVKTTTGTLGVKKMAIFIFDDTSNSYRVREQEGLNNIGEFNIADNNGIVSWLKENREIFVKEEMEKVLGHDEIAPIEEALGKIEASVCVPVMLKENLMGIITLSEKSSGDMYSHIDERILERLGSQLAVTLNHIRTVAELNKERQQAEITKNRLNAITTMSYGLADRIRNDLFSLYVFLGDFPMMLKQFEDKLPSNVKESLQTHYKASYGGVDKFIKLSKEITNLCKPEGLNPQIYEPKIIIDMADEVEKDLKYEMQNKEIKIEKIIAGTPPATYFDKEAIRRILWNLIQNSIHAIPEGKKGMIKVNVTGPVKRDEIEFLRIIVEDNGVGIPAGNLENIFNPFFTTKGTAGGLGLGLTICQFIVNQHDGIIEIDHTELDKGTTIHIDLPVRTEPPKPTVDYKDILGQFPARRK